MTGHLVCCTYAINRFIQNIHPKYLRNNFPYLLIIFDSHIMLRKDGKILIQDGEAGMSLFSRAAWQHVSVSDNLTGCL